MPPPAPRRWTSTPLMTARQCRRRRACGRRGRLRGARGGRHPRDFAAEGFEPATTSTWRPPSTRSTWTAAPRSPVRASTSSRASAPASRWRCCLAMQRAIAAGFTPMITPTLVNRTTMAGAGFIDHHLDEVYHLPADDLFLTGTSEGRARRLSRGRDPRPLAGPHPVCRSVELLPPRGRVPRQRTPRASSGSTSSTRSMFVTAARGRRAEHQRLLTMERR